MRILFLEDDENRIRKARQGFVGHRLVVAVTAEEAVAELNSQQFDLASLDHDLGGTVMAESDENSGHAVAKHIAAMSAPPPVIVHSFNPVGAGLMMNCLSGATPCFRALFDTPLYWQLVASAA